MSSFSDDLHDAISATSTPRQAVDAFIEWYEATAIHDKRDFTTEIRQLSDPERQFVCLHIAWSTIVSDGFVEYFNQVEEDWFDELACSALHELEQTSSADALSRAREVFDRFGEDFPADIDEELYDELLEPTEDLEIQIGQWLLEQI